MFLILYGDFTPANALPLKTAQVGDIIFNPVDTKLYCLTGVDSNFFPNYDEPSAYQFIGTRTDNSTIEYDNSGKIRVKDSGITASKLNDNVVLTTQGLSKPAGGAIRAKYDSITISVNGSGELQVVQGGINLGSINSTNQSLNVGNITLTNYRTAPGPSGSVGLLWVDGSGYVRITT